MIRRQFLKFAAITGATGLASIGTLDVLEHHEHEPAGETKTAQWRVRGFTCPTCAVGLETMLERQKGVKSVQATYPEAVVTVQYSPTQINEVSLRSFITDLGFTAEHKG
ncbi:MAG: heavy metal-associated domain-containing protein [Acidobacteriaceae bacterium]